MLQIDLRGKEFVVLAHYKDGSNKVVGRYTDKEEAKKAGKKFFATAEPGVTASLVRGDVKDSGDTVGMFQVYEYWR